MEIEVKKGIKLSQNAMDKMKEKVNSAEINGNLIFLFAVL